MLTRCVPKFRSRSLSSPSETLLEHSRATFLSERLRRFHFAIKSCGFPAISRVNRTLRCDAHQLVSSESLSAPVRNTPRTFRRASVNQRVEMCCQENIYPRVNAARDIGETPPISGRRNAQQSIPHLNPNQANPSPQPTRDGFAPRRVGADRSPAACFSGLRWDTLCPRPETKANRTLIHTCDPTARSELFEF